MGFKSAEGSGYDPHKKAGRETIFPCLILCFSKNWCKTLNGDCIKNEGG